MFLNHHPPEKKDNRGATKKLKQEAVTKQVSLARTITSAFPKFLSFGKCACQEIETNLKTTKIKNSIIYFSFILYIYDIPPYLCYKHIKKYKF